MITAAEINASAFTPEPGSISGLRNAAFATAATPTHKNVAAKIRFKGPSVKRPQLGRLGKYAKFSGFVSIYAWLIGTILAY